ncbi:hypothetical protein [Thermaerobacillus caldiproteolyticus]|uniref:hypothetical protein n=1 Tax=Thermaerobacillus caldiproteolyticus TaxID=247480 RepID=UPI00188DAD4B|nr:hypothetical protein [Anoxybacillus caldiproteolyticus]QPA31616.1 hypothetical protein ISX45_00905 [Anoxybacillus caldiproteolyticus]
MNKVKMYLQKVAVLVTGVFVTLIIIVGSLTGTYNNQSLFSELMKETAKLNLSIGIGLGALVITCLTVQNKTDIKVNKERYYGYIGAMFYFILLNIGVFYLAYFPLNFKGLQIFYYILTLSVNALLLFSTVHVLKLIFNKK